MAESEDSKKDSNPEVCSVPENICVAPEKLDSKNHKFDAKNFFESYKYAWSGLGLIVKNERNFRIQIAFSIVITLMGLFFDITHTDWVAIAVLIALVLVAEAFNSVIEAICDTVSQDYRVNIRYAKDVSAGAVLLSAIVSAVAGGIIFFPYIWELFLEIINR